MEKLSKLTIAIFVLTAATVAVNLFNIPNKEGISSLLAILMAGITLRKDHESDKDAKKLNEELKEIKALSLTNLQDVKDGLSVLPDEVNATLMIYLSPVPAELIGRFIFNNNYYAPKQYNYVSGYFDYTGEPFYEIPKLMLWVEFLDRNNRENVIYSSREPIRFRQNIEVLSPSINFSYLGSGENPARVMINVGNLRLIMNHHGQRTLWRDIADSILRVSIYNGNERDNFPNFRKHLASFKMADQSGYLDINFNNFEDVGDGNIFEADLSAR